MSKVTIKKPERRQDSVLVSLLLTLNKFNNFFSVYIVDFEQANVCWEISKLVKTNNTLKHATQAT